MLRAYILAKKDITWLQKEVKELYLHLKSVHNFIDQYIRKRNFEIVSFSYLCLPMKKELPIYICAHAILRQGDEILLTLRDQTRFASGFYSVISGGTESGESVKEATIREIYEETGLKVKEEDLAFHTVVHSQEEDFIHMATFFITDTWEGEIQNKEPHKHKELKFYPIHQLPSNMIPYVIKALEGLDDAQTHAYYREYRWDD